MPVSFFIYPPIYQYILHIFYPIFYPIFVRFLYWESLAIIPVAVPAATAVTPFTTAVVSAVASDAR